MLQAHAQATLPAPHRAWAMDTAHPPPLGRHLRTATFSFSSSALEYPGPSATRHNLLTACHLELAASSLFNVYIPYRVNVEQVADDGDGFAIALHATMSALHKNGLGSRILRERCSFAAVNVAGVALERRPCRLFISGTKDRGEFGCFDGFGCKIISPFLACHFRLQTSCSQL